MSLEFVRRDRLVVRRSRLVRVMCKPERCGEQSNDARQAISDDGVGSMPCRVVHLHDTRRMAVALVCGVDDPVDLHS